MQKALTDAFIARLTAPTAGRTEVSDKLSRRIVLADGTRLERLKDAADLIADKFATVTQWGTLERAITLLIEAAETGTRADIAAATTQIEIVLRDRRLL